MNQSQVKEEYQHIDERISSIYDGEYFRIIQRKGDILIVQCITCGPDAPQLRASRRSNGNILKHIQRRHSELLAKIRIEKNIKCRAAGIRRSTMKNESSNKSFEPKIINTTLSEDAKPRMVFIEASTSDSIGNFHYLDPNLDKTDSDGEIQLLQSDDNLISEEQEASDFITDNTDNLNEINHDEHTANKHHDTKSDHIDCEYDDCPETSCSEDVKTKSSLNKEVMELKKELMLREFDELQEMRREKHRFEIEILRRELEFKKIEHRKKIELLDKQLKEK